ncbi:MAG: ABC transporter ATP-binding protein, partial [Bacteroidetes bacterium]
MLQATGITKSYKTLQVLKGVNLTLQQGEVVSIVGSSGAGKSTLLHIAGTLDVPDSGTITIQGQPISQLNRKALAHFRNTHIGFVFQFHHLLPEFTALENVCMPGWISKRPTATLQAEAKDLLSIMGLKDRFAHKPHQLSGGEQQRVAVARALINKPAVVFADEPTGNLDSQHAEELHALFFHLCSQLGQTFLIVTHNATLAGLSHRQLH